MANTILCLGEALIDMICTDRNLPVSQGTHFVKQAGGAPMNAAAAIAALGGRAELLAKVGTDPFGDFLVETMQALHIGTRRIVRDVHAGTTMAYVSTTTDGDRDFYFQRGADGLLTIDEADAVPLDDIALVHFGSATAFLGGPLQDTYAHMLIRAIESKRLISFDPNYRQQLLAGRQARFTEQCLHYIRQAHFCKLSADEALLLTGTNTITTAANRLLEMSAAVFAITLGPDGALLGLHGKTYHVPGVQTTVVDTTGAGDAFMGAVLYQLRNDTPSTISHISANDWQARLEKANRVAAQTCAYLGALEAYRHIRQE